jgi:hypothetical protein
MFPILGIMASQISGHLSTPAYESIATANGDGSSGLITFSSIPSIFKHLQLRFIGKDTYSGGAGPSNMQIRMNSDSTEANYYYHYLRGNGSTASASAGNSPSFLASVSTSSDNADIFGVGVIDILDYGNTSKNTTTRILGGLDYNGSGVVQLVSILWNNTAAVNSVTLYNATGWTTETQFALYGIKG